MRLLLTGGSGFLGRALVKRIPQGVIALGRTPVAGVENRAVDLTDAAAVRASLAPGDFDAIVHLAGTAAKGEPTFDEGVELIRVHHQLAANLAHALPARWHGRVIHASGMTVYGLPQQPVVHEDHPLRPWHLYGLAKVVAEDAWRAAAPADLWMLRFPGLFSEERRSGAVWAFARAAASGQPLRVLADRPTPWDILHVDDATEAIVHALAAPGPGPGPMNISYGEPTSLDTVAGWFAAEVGAQVVLAGRAQPLLHLDVTRARDRFPWPPRALAERLRAMLTAAR